MAANAKKPRNKENISANSGRVSSNRLAPIVLSQGGSNRVTRILRGGGTTKMLRNVTVERNISGVERCPRMYLQEHMKFKAVSKRRKWYFCGSYIGCLSETMWKMCTMSK